MQSQITQEAIDQADARVLMLKHTLNDSSSSSSSSGQHQQQLSPTTIDFSNLDALSENHIEFLCEAIQTHKLDSLKSLFLPSHILFLKDSQPNNKLIEAFQHHPCIELISWFPSCRNHPPPRNRRNASHHWWAAEASDVLLEHIVVIENEEEEEEDEEEVNKNLDNSLNENEQQQQMLLPNQIMDEEEELSENENQHQHHQKLVDENLFTPIQRPLKEQELREDNENDTANEQEQEQQHQTKQQQKQPTDIKQKQRWLTLCKMITTIRTTPSLICLCLPNWFISPVDDDNDNSINNKNNDHEINENSASSSSSLFTTYKCNEESCFSPVCRDYIIRVFGRDPSVDIFNQPEKFLQAQLQRPFDDEDVFDVVPPLVVAQVLRSLVDYCLTINQLRFSNNISEEKQQQHGEEDEYLKTILVSRVWKIVETLLGDTSTASHGTLMLEGADYYYHDIQSPFLQKRKNNDENDFSNNNNGNDLIVEDLEDLEDENTQQQGETKTNTINNNSEEKQQQQEKEESPSTSSYSPNNKKHHQTKLQLLTKTTPQRTKLVKLALDLVFLTPFGLPRMNLEFWNKLTTIDLSGHGRAFGDEGALVIAKFFRDSEGMTPVERLHLRANHISDVGFSAVVNTLFETENQYLREVDFSENVICDSVAKEMLPGLRGVRCVIRTLLLEENAVSPETASLLATALLLCGQPAPLRRLVANLEDDVEILRAMELSRTGIEDLGCKLLLQAIRKSAFQTLTSIDLSCNRIADDGAGVCARMIDACQSLKKMDLSNNEIASRGAESLIASAAAQRSLATLDVSDQRPHPLPDHTLQRMEFAIALHGAPVMIQHQVAAVIRGDHSATRVTFNRISEGLLQLTTHHIRVALSAVTEAPKRIAIRTLQIKDHDVNSLDSNSKNNNNNKETEEGKQENRLTKQALQKLSTSANNGATTTTKNSSSPLSPSASFSAGAGSPFCTSLLPTSPHQSNKNQSNNFFAIPILCDVKNLLPDIFTTVVVRQIVILDLSGNGLDHTCAQQIATFLAGGVFASTTATATTTTGGGGGGGSSSPVSSALHHHDTNNKKKKNKVVSTSSFFPSSSKKKKMNRNKSSKKQKLDHDKKMTEIQKLRRSSLEEEEDENENILQEKSEIELDIINEQGEKADENDESELGVDDEEEEEEQEETESDHNDDEEEIHNNSNNNNNKNNFLNRTNDLSFTLRGSNSLSEIILDNNRFSATAADIFYDTCLRKNFTLTKLSLNGNTSVTPHQQEDISLACDLNYLGKLLKQRIVELLLDRTGTGFVELDVSPFLLLNNNNNMSNSNSISNNSNSNNNIPFPTNPKFHLSALQVDNKNKNNKNNEDTTNATATTNSNYTRFGDRGAEIFSAAVSKLSRVKTIILQRCGIGDEGALYISKMMQQHPHLSSVDLSHNNISVHGAQQLVSALRVNPRINQLLLDGNACSMDADLYRDLLAALKQNRNISSLSNSSGNKMNAANNNDNVDASSVTLLQQQPDGATTTTSGASRSVGKSFTLDVNVETSTIYTNRPQFDISSIRPKLQHAMHSSAYDNDDGDNDGVHHHHQGEGGGVVEVLDDDITIFAEKEIRNKKKIADNAAASHQDNTTATAAAVAAAAATSGYNEYDESVRDYLREEKRVQDAIFLDAMKSLWKTSSK